MRLIGPTAAARTTAPAVPTTRQATWLFAILFVTATVSGRAGDLGDVPPGGFRSPEGDRRFTSAAGAKPINNLVFELLHVTAPGTRAHRFRNPREGWVYLRVTPAAGNRPAAVALDSQPVALALVNGQLEAMRFLTAGPHTVGLAPGGPEAAALEVRSIGELFYATYGGNPHVSETGNYSWDFLRRHCLHHYNSIIGSSSSNPDGTSPQEAELRAWVAAGKRWFSLEPVPFRPDTTADQTFDHWTRAIGMSHPLMSGIWIDEFGANPRNGKTPEQWYKLWINAIRRIAADSRYRGRKLYAYGPIGMRPAERFRVMFPFVKTLIDSGYRLGSEWYLPEGLSRPGRVINNTNDLLAEFSPGWEGANRESFEKGVPGSASERVIVLSLLSEPGWETGDLYSKYDYNVFLDAQFQFVATDPSFFATRGVQGYQSSYCGEEQLRLFARLVRHYAIEGNTKRLLEDPYVLTHLQNSDFTGGTTGWSLQLAEGAGDGASIKVVTAPGFGRMQGKYHAPPGAGDVALRTRRSGARPNLVSQTIEGLTPGRLYSLRLITGDYRELIGKQSQRRKHAVSVTIEKGQLVADKCFQAVVSSGYWYPYGAFNANNPYWINYHQRVFRASGKTARLVLSDWVSRQASDGPTGQQLLWNFIQLQPYFPE